MEADELARLRRICPEARDPAKKGPSNRRNAVAQRNTSSPPRPIKLTVSLQMKAPEPVGMRLRPRERLKNLYLEQISELLVVVAVGETAVKA